MGREENTMWEAVTAVATVVLAIVAVVSLRRHGK
jgi:hypothetical protein